MFGEIGLDKLVLLLVVVLLLFGAKRIPEIARSLGKGVRVFKDGFAGPDQSLEHSRAEETSLLRGRSIELR
jgi:sec-independent protein translocase protein TatA